METFNPVRFEIQCAPHILQAEEALQGIFELQSKTACEPTTHLVMSAILPNRAIKVWVAREYELPIAIAE